MALRLTRDDQLIRQLRLPIQRIFIPLALRISISAIFLETQSTDLVARAVFHECLFCFVGPVALGTGAVDAGPLLVFSKVEGAGTGSVALVLGGDYIVPDCVDLVVPAVFPV